MTYVIVNCLNKKWNVQVYESKVLKPYPLVFGSLNILARINIFFQRKTLCDPSLLFVIFEWSLGQLFVIFECIANLLHKHTRNTTKKACCVC